MNIHFIIMISLGLLLIALLAYIFSIWQKVEKEPETAIERINAYLEDKLEERKNARKDEIKKKSRNVDFVYEDELKVNEIHQNIFGNKRPVAGTTTENFRGKIGNTDIGELGGGAEKTTTSEYTKRSASYLFKEIMSEMLEKNELNYYATEYLLHQIDIEEVHKKYLDAEEIHEGVITKIKNSTITNLQADLEGLEGEIVLINGELDISPINENIIFKLLHPISQDSNLSHLLSSPIHFTGKGNDKYLTAIGKREFLRKKRRVNVFGKILGIDGVAVEMQVYTITY